MSGHTTPDRHPAFSSRTSSGLVDDDAEKQSVGGVLTPRTEAVAKSLVETPYDWSLKKKWCTTGTALFYGLIVAINMTSYPFMTSAGVALFDTTPLIYHLGNTSYLLAVAFVPMVLAPMSETLGRKYIYLIAAAAYTIGCIAQAVCDDIAVVIAFRFICGAASSVGHSNAAGTISDLFRSAERGIPMGLFAFIVFLAQGLAPTLATVTVKSQSWRVVAWWHTGLGGFSFLLILVLMKETRLHNLQNAVTAATLPPMSERVKQSVKRPFLLLARDPIVQGLSLWSAFLWGVNYLQLQAIPFVFSREYHWDSVQQAMIMLSVIVSSLLGFAANFHQDALYRKRCVKAGEPVPEARLHYACAGAILAPIGLFIFAWTGVASISPAVPILGIFLFNLALFPIYLSLFAYLADLYQENASSSVAASSFARFVFAALLPLSGDKMYAALGSQKASSLLAAIAAVLAVVPLLLFRYAGKIRAGRAKDACEKP